MKTDPFPLSFLSSGTCFQSSAGAQVPIEQKEEEGALRFAVRGC